MVGGRGADLDRAVLLAHAGQVLEPPDVHERLGLAEPQLHQRHQAVPAGQQLGVAAARRQLGNGVVERRGALVVERRGNHAWPPGGHGLPG